VHVVVILECLQKFAGFDALRFIELRKTFGDVTELAGGNGPAILGEPSRDGMQIGAPGDEACAGAPLGTSSLSLIGSTSCAPASMAAPSMSTAESA
jgi:hypothetical protein